MPKVTLPNPLDESVEVLVIFKKILPPEWRLMDGEELAEALEDDETAVEIEVRVVEDVETGEDITATFFSEVDVDDFSEDIRRLYVEHMMERYADRLVAA